MFKKIKNYLLKSKIKNKSQRFKIDKNSIIRVGSNDVVLISIDYDNYGSISEMNKLTNDLIHAFDSFGLSTIIIPMSSKKIDIKVLKINEKINITKLNKINKI